MPRGTACCCLTSLIAHVLHTGGRYAEAATLRDEAATSMLGWFVGRGEDDPHGHLLRVGVAYNRYMGHAFSARDISEAKVPPFNAVRIRRTRCRNVSSRADMIKQQSRLCVRL